MSHLLTEPESSQLRARLKDVWSWDGGYWYPLETVSRADVLGFDASKLEHRLPEASLRALLISFDAGEVVLFREHDPDERISISRLPHLRWSEAFLAPHSFEWIVYWSHEDTVTFGGSKLIDAVQAKVPDWASLLAFQ